MRTRLAPWRRVRSWRTIALAMTVMVAATLTVTPRAYGAPASSALTVRVVVHSHSSTVLHLRDHSELIIPAGALPNRAVVSATYLTNFHAASASLQPIGSQIHFKVTPAASFRKPLLLEFPVPRTVYERLARMGYFRVATYDTATRRWQGVSTTYDPVTNMVATQLHHFSIWTLAKETFTAAKTIAGCLSAGVGVKTFLECVIKAGITSAGNALLAKVLSAMLPKSCYVDQLLSGSAIGVFTTLANDPNCIPHAGDPPTPQPTVTSVSPNTGSANGGTTVTITGFTAIMANAVYFGSVAAHFQIVVGDWGTITAVAPAGNLGTVDVTIVDPGGTSPLVAADHFTYTSAAPGTPPPTTPPPPTPPPTTPPP